MYSVWVSWHDMFCIFLDAEVPCHVIFFRGTLQMTRDLCIFLLFSLCRWHGSLCFLGMSDNSHVICRYYIYIAFIYLRRQVCSFMPQWSNPSTLNQKKKGRRRVHDIRWTWSTSKRQAFKIEPGKRLLIRNDKPHHVHPTRKRREMESVLGRRPPKRHTPTTLQRQIGTSPTTFRAFRKITMRSEKRKARWRRAVDTLPGRRFFLKTCADHPCDEK